MFVELSPILAAGSTGELFRQILPYAFVGVVVIVVLHFVIAMIFRGAPSERKKWNLWDILIYLGTVACVVLLGATSFVEVIRHGELGGWALFFHMCGAGALTAMLPILALSWAHYNQFGVSAASPLPPKFYWLPKLMFWLILASGLVVTMTMLISMLPIFGSDGLHVLLDIHRYSGLVVVLALVVHLYSVAAQRLGMR